MYALVALLGLISLTCWLQAFTTDAERRARRRRRSASRSRSPRCSTRTTGRCSSARRPGSRGSCCCGARARGGARRLLRTGLIAYGGVVLLYAPWIPNTLYQAAHTGAPWSKAPSLAALASVPGADARRGRRGRRVPRRRRRRRGRCCARAGRSAGRRACAARDRGRSRSCWPGSARSSRRPGRTATSPPASRRSCCSPPPASPTPGGSGWSAWRSSPCCGRSTARPTEKSNVRAVAESIAPSLRPGDLVVATQPEQVSVLHYYLPDGLRYATLTGPVRDTGVTDWRDGVERLEATSAAARPRSRCSTRCGPGQRLALVVPHDLRDRPLERALDAARAAALGGVAPVRLQRPALRPDRDRAGLAVPREPEPGAGPGLPQALTRSRLAARRLRRASARCAA